MHESLLFAELVQMSKWLREHAGCGVTEGDVAEICAAVYGQAANTKNATSGFEKSGLHPYNPDVFTDADFVAADVTDVPLEAVPAMATMEMETSTSTTGRGVIEVANMSPDAVPETAATEMEASTSTAGRGVMEDDVADVPFEVVEAKSCSFTDLIPHPKRVAATSGSRKRKVAHAEVVTRQRWWKRRSCQCQ